MRNFSHIPMLVIIAVLLLTGCRSVSPPEAGGESGPLPQPSPTPMFSHSDSYMLEPVYLPEPSRNERFILETR